MASELSRLTAENITLKADSAAMKKQLDNTKNKVTLLSDQLAAITTQQKKVSDAVFLMKSKMEQKIESSDLDKLLEKSPLNNLVNDHTKRLDEQGDSVAKLNDELSAEAERTTHEISRIESHIENFISNTDDQHKSADTKRHTIVASLDQKAKAKDLESLSQEVANINKNMERLVLIAPQYLRAMLTENFESKGTIPFTPQEGNIQMSWGKATVSVSGVYSISVQLLKAAKGKYASAMLYLNGFEETLLCEPYSNFASVDKDHFLTLSCTTVATVRAGEEIYVNSRYAEGFYGHERDAHSTMAIYLIKAL